MNTRESIRTVRILIYSRDPHLVTLLHNILSGAGYHIRLAETLADSATHFRDNVFDLALLDLRSPTQELSNVPTLIKSSDPEYAFPWIALIQSHSSTQIPPGARGVITLPISARKLLNQVASTIERLTDRYVSEPPHPELTSDDDVYQLLARNVLEQKTLSDIAQTLNSTLDLNTVLTKVVDAATRLTPAEEGLLLLPDESGSNLYIRAEKGIDNETARQFRIRTRDTLAGQVYKTGQPILIDDPNWRELKTAYFVRSLLYVPLQIKDQVIGVLGVNNRTSERTFSKHDMLLLEDLASHAAIAIENARLYGDSVSRSRELQVLVNASEAVNSTLALDGVLDIIANQLTSTLQVAWCEISRLDAYEQCLNVLADYRQVYWDTWDMPQMALSEAEAFLMALDEKRPFPIDRDYFGIGINYTAWVVPLHINEQPLGVLELVYHHHAPPTTMDADGSQIAQIGLAVAIGIDPRKDEDRQRSIAIIDDLLKMTGASSCRLWMLSLAEQRFEQRFDIGYHIWTAAPYPASVLPTLPTVDAILTSHAPRHIHLTDELDTNDLQVLRHYDARSVLLMPLVISNEVLGMVALVDTLHATIYDERHIRLVEALVVQAANAIQNAKLFLDLQNSMEALRQTQGKLVQTARMSAIGELAAAVAHQINNPLTTILVDTELLIQDKNTDDPDAESLEAIHRAGQRAHEVVRRLLSMSYKNKEDQLPELCDINSTISNTLELVSKHIAQSNIELVVDLDNSAPRASGLRGQLEDVWLNLLMNGRDAVKESENATLGIRSYQQDDAVVVDVWDNGPGIPEDIQSSIFEAFFTTKEIGQGTGLGLHICKQIVEKCGGYINIKSRQPHGALFSIYLPTMLPKHER